MSKAKKGVQIGRPFCIWAASKQQRTHIAENKKGCRSTLLKIRLALD
jgi:hypothetical protein